MSDSAAFTPLSPGSTFASRYLLKRRLGMGRLGEVWQATDQRLDMDVALKFFDAYEQSAALESASRKIMKLTHPHLVRVYDFCDDGQRCALVMEYVSGGSLARRLKEKEEGCFEPEEIQTWVKQLWSALAELGEAGMSHGNLNLANLAITEGGELKVMESGLFEIRAATLSPDMTFSYLPCLTPQVLGGKSPGPMDDSYAAGACVYELLTGKPIFLGTNLPQQIRDREIIPVANRRAEIGVGQHPVPQDWEAWIARALSKSAYDRPQAAEMRDKLQYAEPVSTLTAEQAAQAAKQASSPSARLNDLQAKLRTLPKQAWIGLGAAAALAVFYFTSYQPAQAALAKMEADFRTLRLKATTESPATLTKLWAEFQTNYEAPIAYTSRDTDMLTDAGDYQLLQQKAAEDEARLAKAEAQRLQDKREAEIKKLVENLLVKVETTRAEAEAKNVPAASNLKRWQDLLTSMDESTARYKEKDELPAKFKVARSEVEEKIAFWTGEQKSQEAAYASYQQKLSLEIDRLKTVLADTTKGAAPKKIEIDTALTTLLAAVPLGAQDSHLGMIQQLQGWQTEWKGKMESEAPKLPLPLKDLFANTPFKDMPEEKLKVVLAKVYDGFGLNPKEDPDRTKLHEAIVKQQQTSGGIITGQLAVPDLAKAAIPVEAPVEEMDKFITGLMKPVAKVSSGSSSRKKKAPVEEPGFFNRTGSAIKGLFTKDSKSTKKK
jgi:serine/threonine protein kinase